MRVASSSTSAADIADPNQTHHEPDSFIGVRLFCFMNTGTITETKKTADTTTTPKEIFVIIEGGVIHEIVDLPENIHVTVIDYDTEGVERDLLEISPVDGELCLINKW